MNCSFCGEPLTQEFCNLGYQPASNSFLSNLDEPEITYPLKVYVCTSCFLVQLPEVKKATEIFNDEYVYYSSQSPANVSHAKDFVDIMVERFGLNEESHVLEIGSNDGYLLQHLVGKVHCHGCEPVVKCAEQAALKGIPTTTAFFSKKLAESKWWVGDERGFDLICAINTIAHQPDINDFVEGVRLALKPDGVAVFEFPHLLNLIEKCQFDTIYLEHYSYFSFFVINNIFRANKLAIFDVEEIPEHGGSLRIYAQHLDKATFWGASRVLDMLAKERACVADNAYYYTGFQYKVNKIKIDLVDFLIKQKRLGKLVMGYGAPAKANTLLNYCGVHPDLLPFVVDRSPHKQGKFMPGSHIPVVDEAKIRELKPEYILVLAWNLREEIMKQLEYVKEWGCNLVVPIPELKTI